MWPQCGGSNVPLTMHDPGGKSVTLLPQGCEREQVGVEVLRKQAARPSDPGAVESQRVLNPTSCRHYMFGGLMKPPMMLENERAW